MFVQFAFHFVICNVQDVTLVECGVPTYLCFYHCLFYVLNLRFYLLLFKLETPKFKIISVFSTSLLVWVTEDLEL